MRETIPTLCAILLIVLLAAPFTPTASSAAPVVSPDVFITLDQKVLEADAELGHTRIVTFTGSATLNNTLDVTGNVTVTLDAFAEGLAVSVTPNFLTLNADTKEETFQVSGIVPERTSHSKTYTLTVGGEARLVDGGPSSEVGPATALITVGQYFRFAITCNEDAMSECKAGQELTYRLSIANQGNGEDAIAVNMSSETVAKLEDSGFKASLNATNVTIPEGYVRLVELKVTAPSSFEGFYVNEIIILNLVFRSLTSMKEGEAIEEKNYALYIRLVDTGLGGIDISPGMVAAGIAAFLVLAVAGLVITAIILKRRGRKDDRAGPKKGKPSGK